MSKESTERGLDLTRRAKYERVSTRKEEGARRESAFLPGAKDLARLLPRYRGAARR